MYLQKVGNKQKKLGILKVNHEIAGSLSACQRYGSEGQDPYQNVTDPERCQRCWSIPLNFSVDLDHYSHNRTHIQLHSKLICRYLTVFAKTIQKGFLVPVEHFWIYLSSVADPECLSRIPDPNFFYPGSPSKNWSIVTQKIVSKL